MKKTAVVLAAGALGMFLTAMTPVQALAQQAAAK